MSRQEHDLELMAAINGLSDRMEATAGNIESIFRKRQAQVADHITNKIDTRLTDAGWIGHSNNYHINDDNWLSFQFNLRECMPGEDESLQGYPDAAVHEYVVRYYENKGWMANYSMHGCQLTLKVQISPIELEA